jgi:hypothetical protein
VDVDITALDVDITALDVDPHGARSGPRLSAPAQPPSFAPPPMIIFSRSSSVGS